MSDEIIKLENELEKLPKGYISKKKIRDRVYFYLQWIENGQIKSKYIKKNEHDKYLEMIQKRKDLEKKLKLLRSKENGKSDIEELTGDLMMKDIRIASIKKAQIKEIYEADLLPLYLKRTRNIESWLSRRAIDTHRTNSRLLKRVLRLKTDNEIKIVLAVNALTITDNYWFKPKGFKETYQEVRFKENYFDKLALSGDPNSFSLKPSRTPELTNIGSFEKCWRLIDKKWWLYKSENEKELFSEMFICLLGKKLGFDMAEYEIEGGYIRTADFSNNAYYNYESMRSLNDDNDDYHDCFELIYQISEDLAKQYLSIIYMDTLCFNMDRHTDNFGFLRDPKNGEILKMAPNFDNNIALIARGYPNDVSRQNDGLISFFKEFIQNIEQAKQLYQKMTIPLVTKEMIDDCLKHIPIKVDEKYIKDFILNGQGIIRKLIY